MLIMVIAYIHTYRRASKEVLDETTKIKDMTNDTDREKQGGRVGEQIKSSLICPKIKI